MTKFNETFHKRVQHLGRKEKEEVGKDGNIYIIDEEDDTEIVKTKQNVRVEQDTGQWSWGAHQSFQFSEKKFKISEWWRWLSGNGEAISKETMAEWMGRKEDVDKKEITEEFEEINIDTGELVKGVKKVHTEH